MGKFWGFLFFLVPFLGVALFAWAPFNNHWLPRDVSTHGHEIDHLFNFILGLTGVVFIVTELLLFWFIWRYDGATNTSPVKFTHGSHNLEIVWTILPAATLLFIAIYQMNAWTDIKLNKPAMDYTVEVTARQFEWRLRYPGPDGVLGTPTISTTSTNCTSRSTKWCSSSSTAPTYCTTFSSPTSASSKTPSPAPASPSGSRPSSRASSISSAPNCAAGATTR